MGVQRALRRTRRARRVDDDRRVLGRGVAAPEPARRPREGRLEVQRAVDAATAHDDRRPQLGQSVPDLGDFRPVRRVGDDRARARSPATGTRARRGRRARTAGTAIRPARYAATCATPVSWPCESRIATRSPGRRPCATNTLEACSASRATPRTSSRRTLPASSSTISAVAPGRRSAWRPSVAVPMLNRAGMRHRNSARSASYVRDRGAATLTTDARARPPTTGRMTCDGWAASWSTVWRAGRTASARPEGAPGVRVSVEAREVARRDLDADPMAREEDVAGDHQVDLVALGTRRAPRGRSASASEASAPGHAPAARTMPSHRFIANPLGRTSTSFAVQSVSGASVAAHSTTRTGPIDLEVALQRRARVDQHVGAHLDVALVVRAPRARCRASSSCSRRWSGRVSRGRRRTCRPARRPAARRRDSVPSPRSVFARPPEWRYHALPVRPRQRPLAPSRHSLEPMTKTRTGGSSSTPLRLVAQPAVEPAQFSRRLEVEHATARRSRRRPSSSTRCRACGQGPTTSRLRRARPCPRARSPPRTRTCPPRRGRTSRPSPAPGRRAPAQRRVEVERRPSQSSSASCVEPVAPVRDVLGGRRCGRLATAAASGMPRPSRGRRGSGACGRSSAGPTSAGRRG